MKKDNAIHIYNYLYKINILPRGAFKQNQKNLDFMTDSVQ